MELNNRTMKQLNPPSLRYSGQGNRTMKHIFKIATLILLASILGSCSKDIKNNEPVVAILSPAYKQLFLLPDTVNVSFRVVHDKQIEYIRISIVDKNIIPVSNQEFLYPESKVYKGDIDLHLSALPEAISLTPYYVHIVVSDFSQVSHTYLEIELSNTEMKYEGCFLIGRSGIDMLKIDYFNDQHQNEFNTEISGNYSGSDISANANMLYVITYTPHLARALDCINGELIWTKDPQLPYPEFNEILADNNLIYFSTAIGRVIGLTSDDGIQVLTTPVLADTIPVNICVTADYLVSDTRLRNSNSKVWVTYYKQTGSKYQVFPTNYETVAMFDIDNKNRAVVFCNNNSTGHIIIFNAENNVIEDNVIVNNNEIKQSCKIDENDFLFSSDNKIFHFNTRNQSHVEIAETDDIIIDIKFDYVNSRLFVVYPDKAEILSYPELSKIVTIETPYLLKGVELKYGY